MNTEALGAPIAMDMKPVTSSQIQGIGYDEASQTMAITFIKNQKEYHYFSVPKTVFDGFFERPEVSVGKYFEANIRGKFEYKAINKPL